MDELDELLKSDFKPAALAKPSKRPHTATEDRPAVPSENDDAFSYGIKSRLNQADDLLSAAGPKFPLPRGDAARKTGREPPKSAQGNFGIPNDDKEAALEAILSSLEKPEVCGSSVQFI